MIKAPKEVRRDADTNVLAGQHFLTAPLIFLRVLPKPAVAMISVFGEWLTMSAREYSQKRFRYTRCE